MKCTIPEISWHNRDPVLSIDIQPAKKDNSPRRLASGGSDTHVLIWHVCMRDSGVATVEFAADLQRHQRAVNVVRFSPSGEFLASGDDESAIIIWKQKTDQDAPELPGLESETNKEHWLTVRMLRGHVEDVYDLSWSHDSTHLISGSVDNTAIMWDMHKGRNIGMLSDHSGFVQGVAWDPKNQYVATLSSDRTCRVYSIATKKAVSRVSKARLPVPDGSELDGKVVRLFHDDTLKSFFRRLSFSPDGEILVAPSGLIEMPSSNTHCNATYIFTRSGFNRPVIYLPSSDQYTVAVRFCPLLFELHEGESMFALPYRMILAIATQSSVVLYDTQQAEPFGIISNIHYTRLTDMSWSSDGRMLIVSSTDGYCSIITFSAGELGQIYQPKDGSSQLTSGDTCIEITSETIVQCKDLKSEDIDRPVLEQRKANVCVKTEVLPARKPVKRICPISLSKSNNKPTSDCVAAKMDIVSNELSENMITDSDNHSSLNCSTPRKVEFQDTNSEKYLKASANTSDVENNRSGTEILCSDIGIKGKKPLKTFSSINVQSKHDEETLKNTVSDSNVTRLKTSVECIVAHDSSYKTVGADATMMSRITGATPSRSKSENHFLENESNNENFSISTPNGSSDDRENEISSQSEAMETDIEIISCISTLKRPNDKKSQETSQATESTKKGESQDMLSQRIATDMIDKVFNNVAADNRITSEVTTDDVGSEFHHKGTNVTNKCGDTPQSLASEGIENVLPHDIAEHYNEKKDSTAGIRATSPECTVDANNEIIQTTPRKATEEEVMNLDVSPHLSPSRAEAKSCNLTPTQQGKRTPRRVQFVTLASPKSKKQLL